MMKIRNTLYFKSLNSKNIKCRQEISLYLKSIIKKENIANKIKIQKIHKISKNLKKKYYYFYTTLETINTKLSKKNNRMISFKEKLLEN